MLSAHSDWLQLGDEQQVLVTSEETEKNEMASCFASVTNYSTCVVYTKTTNHFGSVGESGGFFVDQFNYVLVIIENSLL